LLKTSINLLTNKNNVHHKKRNESIEKNKINEKNIYNISDVIFALQIVVGKNINILENSKIDINGDGRIGIEESISILRFCAGLEKYTQNNDPNEISLVLEMIQSNVDVSEVLDEAILIAVQAIWTASEQNYGMPTFTGNLIQNGNYFYYSNNTQDKMVVSFSNGIQVYIKTNANLFTGYIEDTWEEFLDNHQIEFDIFIENGIDLHIQSVTSPTWNCDDDYNHYCVKWNRYIKGDIIVDEKASTVDLNFTGKKMWGDPSGQIILFKETQDIAGKYISNLSNINLSESYTYQTSYNSYSKYEVQTYINEKEITAKIGETNFQLTNYKVKWESDATLNDGIAVKRVSSPNYWNAQGILYKDGNLFGNVKFDGPVINDTTGPKVILILLNGESFEIFKPLDLF